MTWRDYTPEEEAQYRAQIDRLADAGSLWAQTLRICLAQGYVLTNSDRKYLEELEDHER